MRVIDFTDGYTSSGAPSSGSVAQNSLASYASDAAYVSGKGSAAADGDAYYNTTSDAMRIYQNGAWHFVKTGVLLAFASTADFVTAKGSAAADGDCFYDTALDCMRLYQAGAWGQLWASASKTVTGSATDLVSDGTIYLNGTGLTRTLPTAVGCAGKRLTYKNVVDAGSSPNTIDGNSTETIDGQTTYILTDQYHFVTIESDGANWMIVAAG